MWRYWQLSFNSRNSQWYKRRSRKQSTRSVRNCRYIFFLKFSKVSIFFNWSVFAVKSSICSITANVGEGAKNAVYSAGEAVGMKMLMHFFCFLHAEFPILFTSISLRIGRSLGAGCSCSFLGSWNNGFLVR